MRKFPLFILFGLFITGFISCDTGDYYEIYEDDTIEAVQLDSKIIDAELSKIYDDESVEEPEEIESEKDLKEDQVD